MISIRQKDEAENCNARPSRWLRLTMSLAPVKDIHGYAEYKVGTREGKLLQRADIEEPTSYGWGSTS